MQLLMKQVISTVVREVDLLPAEARSERARKSAIAFVPDKHARVIAMSRDAAAQVRVLSAASR